MNAESRAPRRADAAERDNRGLNAWLSIDRERALACFAPDATYHVSAWRERMLDLFDGMGRKAKAA